MNNSIEQKLKHDAQVFKQTPPESVRQSIQTGIEKVQITSQPKSRSSFNWLMPAGLASAALLVLVMNLVPTNNPTTSIDNSIQSQSFIKISQIDINDFSKSFESNLTSRIKAEKKALQADFNYMKTMFTL